MSKDPFSPISQHLDANTERTEQRLEELAHLLESADSEMVARLRLQPQWLHHFKERCGANSGFR